MIFLKVFASRMEKNGSMVQYGIVWQQKKHDIFKAFFL